MPHKHIDISYHAEPDFKCDYYQLCACGCGTELYKGMTYYGLPDGNAIYIECLSNYIKKNIRRLP